MPQREHEFHFNKLPKGKWSRSVFEKIQKFVSANNAHEMANILLSLCKKYSDLEIEDKLGNVEILIQTIQNSFQHSSNDPALFTINSLISIANIVALRSLHRPLEKALSKILVEPLRRLFNSNENYEHSEFQKSNNYENTQNTTTTTTTPLSLNRQQDLINWEEDDEFIHFNSNFNTKSTITLNPIQQPSSTNTNQNTRSLHLLDDDSCFKIFASHCLTPIRPKSRNSTLDLTPTLDPISSWSSGTTTSMSMSDTSGSGYFSDSDCSSLQTYSKSFDNLNNVSATPSERSPIPHWNDPRVLNNHKTVDHKHQQLILREIADGKSTLQICALLETFEMKPYLSETIQGYERQGHSTETFGVRLVRHLMDMDEYDEALTVILRFFESRDYTLDQEIIPLLLISKDLAFIHKYVGDLLDVCEATLSIIDQCFLRLLSHWEEEGYFGVPPRELYFDTAPGHSSSQRLDELLETQTEFRITLVEIAVSLMMRFNLESSITQPNPRFPSISTFVQYVRAVSLLDSIPISESLESNLRGERVTKKESTKYPWMMLPFVISLIQGDEKAQSLVIRYCILSRGDRFTANFLSAKMNIGEVYLRWANWNDVKADQQSINPEIPTKSDIIFFSQSNSFEDTQSPPGVDGVNNDLWPDADMPAVLSQAPIKWNIPPTISSLKTQIFESRPRNISTGRNVSQLFYRLPPETDIVFVDKIDQLDQLRNSLSNSRVVGMNLKWYFLRGQGAYQDRNFEGIWFSDEKMVASQKNSKSKFYKKYIPKRTSLVQLACDYDDCVYLIDIIKCSRDVSERLGFLFADLFSNPYILKIAFSWESYKELLEAAFPILRQKRYSLQNLIDLRYIWIKTVTHAHSTEDDITLSDINSNISIVNNSKASSIRRQRIGSHSISGDVEYLEAWSRASQGCRMKRPPHTGLSGLVQTFLGKSLDKKEKNLNWDRRPLTKKQAYSAAMDARCLLSIYSILERTLRVD